MMNLDTLNGETPFKVHLTWFYRIYLLSFHGYFYFVAIEQKQQNKMLLMDKCVNSISYKKPSAEKVTPLSALDTKKK